MAIHYQGPKREARALDAFVKLMRASNSVHAQAMRTLAGVDLTPSQFGVLEALDHLGPMTLTELARKILRTSGNLTMVAGNLARRGLVRRERSPQDRRAVRVSLTRKGEALVRAIFPGHAAGIARLMAHLTAGEQEQLAALCRKLGRAAAAG